MGASSVTGVGLGAAGNLKGPSNGRNQFVAQVTPHVIMAQEVTLAAGTATVTFPTPLTGSETNYVVLITSSSALATVSGKTNNVDGDFASFTITGTGTAEIGWCVINKGWA